MLSAPALAITAKKCLLILVQERFRQTHLAQGLLMVFLNVYDKQCPTQCGISHIVYHFFRCAVCAGLLKQVIDASIAADVPLSGENALQRYDQQAFDRITESAVGQSARAGRLQQLTFLRMGDLMFDNWSAFTQFLQRLQCPPCEA